MPEKDTFHDQVQVHQFHHPGLTNIPNASPPGTSGGMPSATTPPSYAGLQLPSAFMAYHSPLSQSLEQRAQHDPARFLWDPTAAAAAAAAQGAFHHPSAHG